MRQSGKLPKLDFEEIEPKQRAVKTEVNRYIEEVLGSIEGGVLLPGTTYDQEYAFVAGFLQGIAACFESVQVSVSRMDPIIAPMVAQSFHGHASFIIEVAKELRAQQKK